MTKNDKSTKFYSNAQERKVSSLLDMKQVSGSGGPCFCCGDILGDMFLGECKTSMKEKSSFSVKKEWIDKNNIERVQLQKPYSFLAISFTPEADTNYFIIGEKEMKKFVELLREENKNEEN
jgi:hypothetical protein